MSHWGNSRQLTQVSYGLVKANPGMSRWTVRAAVHGAVVGAVGVLGGLALIVVGAEISDRADGGAVGVVALVLGAVVVLLAVVAGLTAANLQLAGLVSATDDVLHGRELDEQAARNAARSRLATLAAWSGISVAVGALVSTIRGDGDGGVVTSIVRTLLAGLVASVWAVVTTLVLPVIVLERLGAVAAVKRSAGIVRSTWGETVFASVRIGTRFGLMFGLPGAGLLIGGIVLGVAVGGQSLVVAALAAVAGIVLIVIGAVKAATCRNVFGVALYRWANGDGPLGPFTEADLRGAVGTRTGPAAVTV